MSSGTGAVLSAASCDEVWYGLHIGYYANCFQGPWPPASADESQRDVEPRKQAIEYTKDHLSRLAAGRRGPRRSPLGVLQAGPDHRARLVDRRARPRRLVDRPLRVLRAAAVRDLRPGLHAAAADPHPPAGRDRAGRDVRRRRSPSASRATGPRPRSRSSSPPRSGWRRPGNGGAAVSRAGRGAMTTTLEPTEVTAPPTRTGTSSSASTVDHDRRARGPGGVGADRTTRLRAARRRLLLPLAGQRPRRRQGLPQPVHVEGARHASNRARPTPRSTRCTSRCSRGSASPRPLAHRLASCLLGAAAVVVVGLVGRKIAGDRAGLIARRRSPRCTRSSGSTTACSSPSRCTCSLIAVTLLFAYRLWESRSLGDAAWLGVRDRAERADPSRSGVPRPAARDPVPVLPEHGRLPKRFAHRARDRVAVPGRDPAVVGAQPHACSTSPTFLATGNGVVLQVSNCDGTYSGQFLGYWDIKCLTADAPPENAQQTRDPARHQRARPRLPPRARSTRRLRARHRRRARRRSTTSATTSTGSRSSSPRASGASGESSARRQEVNFDIFFERRGKWPSWAGAYMYYALVPFAVYALVVMRRRRVPISPMIAIFAMVTITVAAGDGDHPLPRRRRRRPRHPRRCRDRRPHPPFPANTDGYPRRADDGLQPA